MDYVRQVLEKELQNVQVLINNAGKEYREHKRRAEDLRRTLTALNNQAVELEQTLGKPKRPIIVPIAEKG